MMLLSFVIVIRTEIILLVEIIFRNLVEYGIRFLKMFNWD